MIVIKIEKILKGSLNSIPSPSPSVKIQIMGGKVCLRCKGVFKIQKVADMREVGVEYGGKVCRQPLGKGSYVFSESTDFFVITSNRRTFFFPETENLNFDD